MPVHKKSWSTTKKFVAASGVTITMAISFAVWAARTGEQKIVRPYIANIVRMENEPFQQTIVQRLDKFEENVVHDMRITRCIQEIVVDERTRNEAIRRANDTTYKLR
jgi:hypothetical protein